MLGGRQALTTRRQAIQLGIGALGLTLPRLLRAEAERGLAGPAARPGGPGDTRRRARSCILFFMEGGPAHQDLWDMKPDAPLEYRGEFKPMSTSAPGVQVCEHLPLLAREMRHVALVRSVTHSIVDHNAGAYYALTGKQPFESGQLVRGPSPKLFPTYGSVLAKLRPSGKPLPDFVHIPDVLSNLNFDLPGQFAGFLGRELDPYVAGDPSLEGFAPNGMTLTEGVSAERLRERRRLLGALSAASRGRAPVEAPDLDAHHGKAFEILGSPLVRRAFDLTEEKGSVRERYGFDHGADRSRLAREFGGVPHLGQSMLLARRLIEAGVRLVTVCAGRRYCQAWDTHRQHFPLMRRSLLPMTDRAFSALLEDLHQRGLLEETLVVAMGEFGRTPRVGQITSDAGADKGGRDHWPHCYTVLFAGGGIAGGAVHGASDRYAAYPARDPVAPEDIAATIYAALGVDPSTVIRDPLDRPHELATGRVIEPIFA
ncbi:MAG: DUF1501 domain-containing protein [Planctomycetes bacterium]|nr:DUF1501 domain-containing protein [Planctomycetota bacterium]